VGAAQISRLSEADAMQALSDGGLLIAASSQLAAQWRQRYAHARNGLAETPRICTWSGWMQQLCMADAQAPVPLTSVQEGLLWERVICDDLPPDYPLGSLRGLASQAASAYELLVQYRIPLDDLGNSFSEESEALARWIESMHANLSSGALSGRALGADLPRLLLERAALLPRACAILFDGFDKFTPLQQGWHRSLAEAGCTLHSVSEASHTGQVELSCLSDEAAEYRFVASQIRTLLDECPHKSVAVVIPQGCDQALLRRILDEELLDDYWQQAAPREQAVHMSGEMLASLPLISQMLKLLSLTGRGGAGFADVSSLLFSPGLKGFQEERLERARLDAVWREGNRNYVSFKSLLASDELLSVPALADVFRQLLLWKTNAQHAREWVQAVHGLLQATGFLRTNTGEGWRTGYEVQQLNAFRDCLGSLVAADAIGERMEWERFLLLLRQVCKQSLLTLSVRYPQVSVVSLVSIAGLRFDTLFAVGLDAEALPVTVKVQPLLALSVQRKYGLPGATPEQSYASSVFLCEQLLHAASDLHLSYGRQREEREQVASSLLGDIKEQPDIEHAAVAHKVGTSDTESYEDGTSVPLPAEESVRGGASIIRNQSACPFRAFATHRLGIAALGETTPGIEAKEKGSLIHHALQYIWQRLASRQALLALDDAATAELIDEAILHAWQVCRMKTMDAVRRYEQQRMHGVLLEWLELERARPAFTVLECEREYRLRLPESSAVQFAVNIKADRIDEDEQGKRILIDYKTGKGQGSTKWMGSRMQEPQLPLYSMAAGLGENDAVAFARVRSGDVGFEGLSGEHTGIKGIAQCDGKYGRPEDWRQVLEDWRRDINVLAGEFVHGRTQVSPRDAHACDYCGLEAVCRIDETGFDSESGEEA